MSRTYLALCQQLAREVRIPGTGPSTVLNQAGELEKVVRYIKDADRDIKNRWIDWDFLWSEFSSTTVVDQFTLADASPTNLNQWSEDRFVYDPTGENFVELGYVEYRDYRRMVLGTQTSDTPGQITIKPDNTLSLYPKPAEAKTVTGEYWKKGVTLAADDDVSEIPEAYDRIIIVRAKLYYAEAEDAPEIMAAALSEHEDLIRTLESNFLPDQKNHTRARAEHNEPILSE